MILFEGKTAMMLSYMVDKMPQDYQPTVSDTFTVDIKMGEELVTLNIHDTAGQDEFERWNLWGIPRAIHTFLIPIDL